MATLLVLCCLCVLLLVSASQQGTLGWMWASSCFQLKLSSEGYNRMLRFVSPCIAQPCC